MPGRPEKTENADPAVRTASPLVRALGVLGLALVSFAFALLLAELGLRIAWPWVRPDAEKQAPAPRRPPASAEAAEGPNLRTVFELLRPNARGFHKGLPFRNNSAGFRGPEVSKVPAAGVFRIVVAGDSVTMGSGVLEQETYAARLQASLDERRPEGRYAVLNLGVSGLNTERVVDRIERIGMPHHPDLIVYGYTLNDIEGPAYVSTMQKGSLKELFGRLQCASRSPSYLVRAVYPRWVQLRNNVFRPHGTLQHDRHFNYWGNPPAWHAVEAGLDRLAALAAEAGVCVHVFIHTGTNELASQASTHRITAKVEDAARRRGFSVTQSRPYFEGLDPSQLRLSVFDSHPNAAGHEVLARALTDGLLELPERCWSRPDS